MKDLTVLKPKVSIIGCGNVGMRYAYALMIRGIAREITIVDVDRKRAEGEAMDLSHGVPYISPVEVHAGDYADIKNSDLVVITAGKKQKPDQTRIDLVKDNVQLYRMIIPKIVKYAPAAVYMIVSNPVDALSYAAYRFSGKPASEVIGSGTVLDSARLRILLARHCTIDSRNLHAYILGEHGDTEFAAWSNAMVGGVLLKEYCTVCRKCGVCRREEDFEKIFAEVRDSAYKIIEKKGETSYGIGLALTRITQAILRDENSVLPVSSLVQGYLGITDVYLSLPAVVNKNGVREVLNLSLSSEEQNLLVRSAEAIKKALKEAGL